MTKKTLPYLLFIVVCNCKPLSLFAQLQRYKFEQIDSLQKEEPRPVFVFIHTTWCKYCEAMEQTTFKNKKITDLLNKKYYCIYLEAETKQDIFFNHHLFKYKTNGNNTGRHELAEQLATINGQIAFPTICILNQETAIIFQHSNYVSSEDLNQILNKLINNN